MNKFLPQTGGHSLHLDEFMLMQDSYFDGFKALVNKIAPTGNMIVDGFIVDQSGVSIVFTSGFVTINGEIFKIESGTFTKDTSKTLYVKPVEVTIPPSPITYEDTVAKNVHLQRKVILKYYDSLTDTNGVNYNDLAYCGSVLEGSILPWYPPAGKTVTDFFDATGLGIGKALGYAICNGLNNTLDLRGMYLSMATSVPFAGGSAPLNTALAGTVAVPGTISGRNLVQLTQGQIPNYALTLNVVDPGHTHFLHLVLYSPGTGTQKPAGNSGGVSGGFDGYINNAVTGISVNGLSGGNDEAHENRPATFPSYYITRVR